MEEVNQPDNNARCRICLSGDQHDSVPLDGEADDKLTYADLITLISGVVVSSNDNKCNL